MCFRYISGVQNADHQGNADQNQNEISFQLCQNDLLPRLVTLVTKKKKRNDRYQWRFGEKGTLAHTVGENINSFSLYGKGYRDSSQN